MATKKKAKKLVAMPKPMKQRGSKKTLPEAAQTLNPVVEKEATKLAKKNEKLADKIAAAPDAPHIEARLHVGELSVVVDAYSLERTIGAGMYGHGQGLVDAYPDTVWSGLLSHLGLPAFPLDRVVAERPVKRLVQRLWYEACGGGVPENRAAVFTARDVEAGSTYKQELPKAVEAVKAKSERSRASFGKARGGVTVYAPTDKLKKAEVKGQAAVLLAFFKASKWAPTTTAKAAEGMIAQGLVTTTKPERIAAFYLCQWVKSGLLTKSTEAGE